MSADNYIVVAKGDDQKFRGYMGFASDEIDDSELVKYGRPRWEADSREQAVVNCESETLLEYGYRFLGE